MGMPDFDGAAKRSGRLTALDGCAFTVRPGRLTGFQVYARRSPRPAPATGPISRPPQYLCKDKP